MEQGQVKRAIDQRYLSLDAMRGLAALSVVAFHMNGDITPSAFLAVDFFFALSGFVIADTYMSRLRGPLSAPQFMVHRLIRLYPLFLVGLLLGLLQMAAMAVAHLKAFEVKETAISTVFNVFIIPSPVYFLFPRTNEIYGLFPLNGPAWSLFFEFVINLCFAFFLFRLKPRYLIGIAAVAFAALAYSVVQYQTLNIGWDWPTIQVGFLRVVFSFIVGVLIYYLKDKLPRHHGWAALLPILALVGCLFMNTKGETTVIFDIAFCLVLSPLIIISGIMLELPNSLKKIGYQLGYVSYPIYILHRGFINIYHALAYKLKINPVISSVAFILFVVVFAYVTSIIFDKIVKAMRQKYRI